MDFFLIRYLIKSYSRLKKLAGRIEEIYKTNDKFGRHSVCVFAIFIAVLNLLLTIAGNLLTGQFSEDRVFLTVYISINIIVIAVLIFDERKLKAYKVKKGMSDKEEAFLRAIAAEKGVNPITLKKVEKNENDVEEPDSSVKPEQPEQQKPIPVQQKVPPKKETISDLLSAEEIAELELKREREKEKE